MRIKSRIKKGIAFASIALMSGGILAACGGSGADSGSTTSANSTEATTTAGGSSASGDRPTLRFAGNGGMTMDPATKYEGWVTIRNGVAETLFKLDDAPWRRSPSWQKALLFQMIS